MEDDSDKSQAKFIGLPDVVKNPEQTKQISSLTNNIARLETSLNAEQEDRLEERFTWVCAVALLLDVLAISAMDGSWLFLPIFMLQLVILIGYAQKCGVDWAVQLLAWLLHKVSSIKNDD